MTDPIDLTQLNANWNYPTSIWFGAGRLGEIKQACEQLGITKPLLVTDNGLVSLPLFQKIKDTFSKFQLKFGVFSELQPNPTGSNIEQGVVAFKQSGHDGIIALGGGSALDVGKTIAFIANQTKPLWHFEDIGDNWQDADPEAIVPLIAIPTTAGTGSEVGRAAVIIDEQSQSKKIIFHPKMLPPLVIADAELTQGLPPALTAATGLDAFVHSFEAYCAPGYHPMAEGIALEGMRLVKDWLPVAFADGDNLVARSHMLVASTMGATAFQKGLGAVHALAHPLGAHFNLHHGLLNAVLLPYVVQANRSAIETKVTKLARYLELADTSFNGFFNWLLDFRQQLQIQPTLAQLGLTLDDVKDIGALALADPSAAGNPIVLSAQDYQQLVNHAVQGVLK